MAATPFRRAYDALGPQNLAKALHTLGIQTPNGKVITERWLRESNAPRKDRKNATRAETTAREHRDYIGEAVKGRKTKELRVYAEGTTPAEVRGGAVHMKSARRGNDVWVGDIDRRDKVGAITHTATKDVTKAQLRQLLTGSGLPVDKQVGWRVRLFGEYVGVADFGDSSPKGTKVRHGYSEVHDPKELMQAFRDAEREMTEAHKAAVHEEGLRLGRPLMPKERLAVERRITLGDPNDPEHFPSFAARWANQLAPEGMSWLRVHAVSLGLAE